MKKRTKTLAWLLALVLVFALLPGEVLAAEQDSPEELLAAMTTEEKVTQLLMPALRYYTDEEGTLCGMAELTPDAAALLEEYAFAGVVVFSQNAEDTDTACRLMDDMQRANSGHRTRLLIAADQEGGMVTRLGHGTQMPGSMALGAAGDTALTAVAAGIIGAELMSIGINMDFAPVLDVNSDPANPVIGTRSFSDDPELAAEQGVAFMNALRANLSVSRPFIDVPQGAWYADAVAYVNKRGLMIGMDEAAFSPDGELTRAQFVTVLWRLAGEPAAEHTLPADVPADAWYAEAVRWAVAQSPVENRLFAPNGVLTREEAVTMLWQEARNLGVDVRVGEETSIQRFCDSLEVSEANLPAMQWAVASGVVKGDGEGNLGPGEKLTRAQSAALLMRLDDLLARMR